MNIDIQSCRDKSMVTEIGILVCGTDDVEIKLQTVLSAMLELVG